MIVPHNFPPISVFPVQSEHGDVHAFQVCRANGDSLTVAEFQWVFERITGQKLGIEEVSTEWFAEEDR